MTFISEMSKGKKKQDWVRGVGGKAAAAERKRKGKKLPRLAPIKAGGGGQRVFFFFCCCAYA